MQDSLLLTGALLLSFLGGFWITAQVFRMIFGTI